MVLKTIPLMHNLIKSGKFYVKSQFGAFSYISILVSHIDGLERSPMSEYPNGLERSQ